ncbi:hypothetical protein AAHA92_16975 [Salvia divinorum]|uniref:Uncharacterized protein n=1 Tax=Salvia divinorum TaxID=28513 RepID=A0ABD1H1B6_SALDI
MKSPIHAHILNPPCEKKNDTAAFTQLRPAALVSRPSLPPSCALAAAASLLRQPSGSFLTTACHRREKGYKLVTDRE